MASTDYNALRPDQIRRNYYRNKLIAHSAAYSTDSSLLYGNNAEHLYLDLVNKGTIIEGGAGIVEITLDDIPAGSVIAVVYNGTAWPARPTSRTDIIVEWQGPSSAPTNNAFINGDRRLFTP